MKLNELAEQLNNALKNIEGVKYDGIEQYKNTISSIISPILENTELGNLLKLESNTIRLVEKFESNCFGGGEELFSIIIDCERDKRTKYINKGKFKDGKVIICKGIDSDLLEFELKNLQPYFNRVNVGKNIRWYNEEIERKKKEISKLEEGRKTEIEKLNNME